MRGSEWVSVWVEPYTYNVAADEQEPWCRTSSDTGVGLFPESFSLVHLTSGFINYVQSEHRGMEPTIDQLSVSVSDGLHRSAPVPFYIIINPNNDETPTLLLANFTVCPAQC